MIFRTLLLCILFIQCSVPKAAFDLEGDDVRTAPEYLYFNNQSINAKAFRWLINDQIVSQEQDLRYYFTESGNYKISLHAIEGDKVSTADHYIGVRAPKECMILISTDKGDMVFELYEQTPIHRRNMLNLIKMGYYEGIAFHRVIEGFIVQAGDNATRTDGKIFSLPETIPNEINTNLLHFKGVLAAARMPDNINPDKASSATQFYIVDGRDVTKEELKFLGDGRSTPYRQSQVEAYLDNGGSPQLDHEYTVFGRMVEGQAVLDSIANVETNDRDRPIDEVRILSIKEIE